MKKELKRGITGLLLSAVILGSVGCARTPQTSVDHSKTQLYVGLYNGGWGRDWLDMAKKRFEEKYSQYEIVITPMKDEYEYAQLKNSIVTDFNDVYITASNYYGYVASGNLLEITDAVTQDMADLGEPGKTVESKMEKTHRNFYKTSAGKYYAVPFGSSVWGLNYDVDLFEEKELFISSSTDSGIVWTSGKAGAPALSAGRDGKVGTYDDGTPVTFSEFEALLNRMVQKNITPFLWSKEEGYVLQILLSMWADAEGVDNFNMIHEMSGTFTDYKGEEVTLKPSNGYDILRMKGRADALKFAELMVSNPAYYNSNSGSYTFTEAQDTYILSKRAAAEGKFNRIAFLLDGGHWYNEAKDYINKTNQTDYATEYANGRRFSVMPFPKVDGNETGTQAAYLESSHEFSIFVNGQTSQSELAKLFVRFMCTDESLRETTKYSGLFRNYEYTMSEEDFAGLPYYYKQIYQLQNSSKVDIVSTRQTNVFYTNNEDLANLSAWVWTGSFKNNQGTMSSLSVPQRDFRDYAKQGLTVEKYMQGSLEQWTAAWKNITV